MPWPLLRLSLRARLYLFCAVLIALLLAPSYYTLQQLAELRDIAYDLQSRHSVALLQVGRVEVALSRLRSETREFIDAPAEENAERLAESLNEVRRAVARFEQGSYQVRADSTLALVEAIAAATAKVDSLALAGDERAAIDVYRAALPLFGAGHEALAGLAQAIQGQSTAAAVRAQSISQRTARTAAAANGLAAGLAVLLALLSVGAITNPLRRLRSSMAAVAGGRFSPPTDLPYGRPDEIGDLTRSFRSMAERLAELDRLKAEFVSIASHELKTPVNVIRGYAEMIEDGTYGDVDGPLADALGYIREQTDVLRERVDQLLAMSRFEAQGLDVRPEPVVLADFFDELERNFAGVAARKRVSFRVQPDPSVPDVASLDRTRVRDELLGNLIGNA
ncbi:MAG: HAMP domain-containing sensor histidine kinase, partial [Gemmatimonadota bacterium]|nr:HAMP domain-containing sensor histidine kinase [Gemmatimonadota bacterium]